MPSFPKPTFNRKINLATEIKALRKYKVNMQEDAIPAKSENTLLLATWNIANFGAQERQAEHLKIIAEIIGWFDVVAIQETKENYHDLDEVVKLLGKGYKYMMSDEGGNNERMAFVYNSDKLTLLHEIAELALPPAEYKSIKLPGIDQSFNGFDRSPYMVSFLAGKFAFTLLNVHLYFGDDSKEASMNRRSLEAFAVGRWASLRGNSKYRFNGIDHVFALGDFNLPMVDEGDPIYKALTAKGLQLPIHSQKIYSNISDDKQYDQVAFLPGSKKRIITHGVFPFDNALFAKIYKTKTKAEFKGYTKYFISDHRPMWMQLDIK